MALLVDEAAGEVVGLVWVGPAPAGRAGWWIYDIEVVPAHRGRGYGRALLEAAEREAQRRGGDSIGLNVFSGNDVALGMYESSGYQVAAIQMQKRFASSTGLGQPQQPGAPSRNLRQATRLRSLAGRPPRREASPSGHPNSDAAAARSRACGRVCTSHAAVLGPRERR
jgi:ribosomal protein S18 acetylase RimI-like enzyme